MLKVHSVFIILSFFLFSFFSFVKPATAATCDNPAASQCSAGGTQIPGTVNCGGQGTGVNIWCCPTGFSIDATTRTCINTTDPDTDSGRIIEPGQAPTNETFRNLNPLIVGSENNPDADRNTLLTAFLGPDYMSPSPAGIINRLLVFAFPLAGLILFIMIIWGGFEMVAGATNKKAMDQGRERITAAVIGFLMLFTAYWLVKVVETIFGVKIL